MGERGINSMNIMFISRQGCTQSSLMWGLSMRGLYQTGKDIRRGVRPLGADHGELPIVVRGQPVPTISGCGVARTLVPSQSELYKCS